MPTYGTPRIIDWLNERQIRPDMILIGEPTSVDRLGDTVKIGRRGSVNMWIEVPGVQGHVAYPHRADQSRRRRWPGSIAALDARPSRRRHRRLPAVEPRVHRDLDADQREQRHSRLGDGAAQHPLQQPPARRRPRRAWSRRSPSARRRARRSRARISGEAFLTPPGQLYDVVVEAIEEETGHRARAVDQRRHVRRPLPDPALPGGRFRPAQRDHAQGRRMRRGRGHPRAVADLRADRAEGARLSDRLARRGRRCRSRRGTPPRTSAGRRR